MTGIQYLNLPGLWEAGSSIAAQQQKNRLTALALGQAESQGHAQSVLYGGLDPKTGVTWMGGRPNLPAEEHSRLFEQAYPKELAAARIKSLFPDPKDQWLSDQQGGLWRLPTTRDGTPQRFGNPTAPYTDLQGTPLGATAPPQAAPTTPTTPGANLATVAPTYQPGPKPTATLNTGPGKLIEGEVPEIYQPYIQAAAETYGVDAGVLSRMLLKETAPRGPLTSPAGARGVGQFMAPTARQYNVDVNDPRSSIDGMAQMLANLLKKYHGDYRLAVGGYNWGEGNVDEWLRTGNGDVSKVKAETLDYVRSIVGLQTPGPTDAAASPPAAGPEGTARGAPGPQTGAAPPAGQPPKHPSGLVPIINTKTREFDTHVGKNPVTGELMRYDALPKGWVIGPDGRPMPDPVWLQTEIDLKRAGKSDVNVNTVQEKEENKVYGGGLAKDYWERVVPRAEAAAEIRSQVATARSIPLTGGKLEPYRATIGAWAESLGKSIGYSPEQTRALLDQWGLGQAASAEAFTGIIQNMVLTKMQAQKGPQTENDAKRIEATVANAANTDDARAFLLRTADAMAARDIEQREFYDQWRTDHNNSFDGAGAAWNKHLATTPLIGVHPDTKQTIFWSEFREAMQQENPGLSPTEILNLWKMKYGRANP